MTTASMIAVASLRMTRSAWPTGPWGSSTPSWHEASITQPRRMLTIRVPGGGETLSASQCPTAAHTRRWNTIAACAGARRFSVTTMPRYCPTSHWNRIPLTGGGGCSQGRTSARRSDTQPLSRWKGCLVADAARRDAAAHLRRSHPAATGDRQFDDQPGGLRAWPVLTVTIYRYQRLRFLDNSRPAHRSRSSSSLWEARIA
jgi:hypothetical protein